MTDGLVLLHGFPLDATMWDPQLAALRAETPVIAVNAPGFGEAPLMMPVMPFPGSARKLSTLGSVNSR